MKDTAPESNPHSADKVRERFHKSTFEKIDGDRRNRILDVALSEFALKGYNAASINEISRNAGISIGSMYSYFASKEDLFLTVIDSGFSVLEEALTLAESDSADPFELFEHLLRVARDYARAYPELTHVYMETATQGLAPLSARLSYRLESISAELYGRVLADGRSRGLIRKDLDDGAISFFLDDILIAVQFSFASDYYRERLRIFAGQNAFDDDGEKLIRSLSALVRSALAPIA
jgi:AcrR family transcriptional regulator